MDADYNPDKGLPNPESDANLNTKDTGNVIGGLKASMSNDGNSEEAKSANKAQLEKMEEQGAEGFKK